MAPTSDLGDFDDSECVISPRLGLNNNGDMHLSDIETFLEHYGACRLETWRPGECILQMASQASPVIQRDRTGHYFWTDFKASSRRRGKDIPVGFEPIKRIVDSVFAQTASKLRLTQDLHPRSSSRESKEDEKIDACYLRIPLSGSEHSCVDVYVPVELERERTKSTRDQANLHALAACHRLLTNDPRRMWIYAMTIEGPMVSLWYFSRSHSVKSIAFNWIEDPVTFVRVLLMFANATLDELGLDPSVHVAAPESGDGNISYVFEVPVQGSEPLFFKTMQPLSMRRPMRIAGRISRVWEVIQVSSADGITVFNPQKLVLKDVCLDTASKTEAENMDALFRDLDHFVGLGLEAEIQNELKANPCVNRQSLVSDPATMERLMSQFTDHEKRFESFDVAAKAHLRRNLTKRNYMSLFLTKRYTWKGQACKELSPDVKRCYSVFSRKYMEESPELDAVDEDIIPQTPWPDEVHGDTPEAHRITSCSRRFAPKCHSRFIYDEVCTTLQDLGTVGEVVDVLCQAIDALHILFAAGWVHRDISSNNIMAFRSSSDQPWTVKLADLEFARPMFDATRELDHDPRTGTPFFMAVEILAQQHLFELYIKPAIDNPFLPKTLATKLGIEEDDERFSYINAFGPTPFDKEDIPVPINLIRTVVPTEGSVVIHNFQHDLESIWWILLWITTSRVNCERSAKKAALVFTHDVKNFSGRRDLLRSGAIKSFSFLGDLDTGVTQTLETLRVAMFKDYLFRPIFGDLELPESYSSIHAKFAELFQWLQHKGGPWRAIKLQRAERGHQTATAQMPPAGVPDIVAGSKREREPSPSPSDSHRPSKRRKDGPGI